MDALRRQVSELSARVASLETQLVQAEREAVMYRAVFHGVPTPIAMTDPKARFVDINAGFERYLGHSLDDLRGKLVATVSDPNDIRKEGAALRELLAGRREHVEYEKRYLRRDGTWTHAHVCVNFLRDQNGAIIGAYAQVADVLDGDIATSGSIRAVDARNRAMLEAVPDLLFLMSADARILDCKPSPFVAISKPVESYLQHQVEEAFAPDVAQRHATLVREVATTGAHRIDVYEVAGQNRHEEAFFTRARTGNVVMAVRDVTARVIAENERDRLTTAIAAQVNELKQWKALVDRAPVAIALLDVDYTIVYTNAALVELLQMPSVAKTNILHRLALEQDGREIERRQRAEQQFQGDVTLVRMDGSQVVVHASIFEILDEQGQVLALGCILRDRSDELHAEAERARLHEEIVNAQNGLIRELETPLMPVAPGVLVMPLVGRIDNSRAERIMATLLQGVVNHRAMAVTIDITGVSMADEEVTLALVRVAQAIRLLGAKTILTGVRASMARELVKFADEVSELETCSTLQRGIAMALKPSRPKKPS